MLRVVGGGSSPPPGAESRGEDCPGAGVGMGREIALPLDGPGNLTRLSA